MFTILLHHGHAPCGILKKTPGGFLPPGKPYGERGFETVKNVYISLPSAAQVQAFAETLTKLDGDFDLISGRYILDARSMMGIFSLDLQKPLQLRINQESDATMQALTPFIIDAPQA